MLVNCILTILFLLSSSDLKLSSSASAGIMENPLPFSMLDVFGSSLMQNDSFCGFSCAALDALGPPPDAILTMPPPPLPPFLQHALSENMSFKDNDDCNLCDLFADPSTIDSEIIMPKPAVKTTDSWLSLVVATILGSTVLFAFLLVFIFKCKKWKIFPVSDSCPILPESFLGGHKSAPPPCSPSDSCISPVVNEKSPQSVITDAPSKKTLISSKYWKRGNNITIGGPDGRQMTNGHTIDPTTDIDDHYAGCTDAASCTSSPVYAELDTNSVPHTLPPTPIPILIGSQGPSISPYAVCNPYSEVADAVRMASLGSSSALLPDASYDNAAYLPSSNSDHYHARSLRRHRASTLAQLGSTTPLLQSHYHLNGSQLNYLTGGRPHKKPRPLHAQQVPRASASLMRMHEEFQDTQFDHPQGYRAPGRRQHGIYTDLPVHSPVLTTFRVPYAFRENPKRPLPPVPGVRL